MARRAAPGKASRRRSQPRIAWGRIAAVLVGAGTLFGAGIGIGAWLTQPASTPVRPAAVAQRPTHKPVIAAAPPAAASPAASPAIALPRLPVRETPAPQAAAPTATLDAVSPPVRHPDPAISAGLPAWRRFAAAADPAHGRPMIAIVLDDLGIDKRRSGRAIDLPAALTLAFLPYATELAEQTGRARDRGHELLVHLPMQPHGHDADPGPNVLDMALGEAEVANRIDWSLKQFTGFVGINNHMGSQFTESPEGMRIVADSLRGHGLLFLDSMTTAKSVGEATARSHGVPTTRRDVFLDNTDSVAEVELRLAQAEKIALANGTAVAIGHPRDATLSVLEAWIPKAKAAGFVLVPLTAVVEARGGVGVQQAARP